MRSMASRRAGACALSVWPSFETSPSAALRMRSELTPRLRLREEHLLPVRRWVLQRAGLRHEVHEGADAAELIVVLDLWILQHIHDVVDARLLARDLEVDLGGLALVRIDDIGRFLHGGDESGVELRILATEFRCGAHHVERHRI